MVAASQPGAAATMTPTPVTRITCEVYRHLAAQAQAALVALGVDLVGTRSRRAVVLRERAPLAFLPPTTRLEEDPSEAFELYVPRERARGVLLALARELGLFAPGRGSIHAEEVEVASPPVLDVVNANVAALDGVERPGERLVRLVLVSAVVQRGRGNDVARCLLERGAAVPSVEFAVGTGVRDRLGLLRIAIPAEKEVVSVLVDADDEAATFDAVIDSGRLDLPGRGFVGAYAVAFGVANPRSLRGLQRHSATMDQIIGALDDLKGGTAWRRRAAEGDARPRRQALTGRLNVTLTGHEGTADGLVAAAMRAGAGGATIGKARLSSPSGRHAVTVAGREVVDFGLAPSAVGVLVDALRAGGAFDDDVACVVETKPLPKAFTFVEARSA
jgi:hypothetical protein